MLVSGINVDPYTITLIWILPSPLDTGHAQYRGKIYCPNEAGQVPKDDWMAARKAEAAAKKAQPQ